MKTVVILGSSRKEGDTAAMVDLLVKQANWDSIDLNDYHIGYYDYAHQNRNDDYVALMKELIGKYDTFLFATPVYWYSMSGIMKVFFDRFTDLLEIEKELGRALRTKKMGAISCSMGNLPGDFFWMPFSETAHYLGMKYIGNAHFISRSENEQKMREFIRCVED